MTHTPRSASAAHDAPAPPPPPPASRTPSPSAPAGEASAPSGSRAPAPRGRRWRFSPLSLIPSLLGLAGLLLFLYPSISAWIVQYNQSQVIAQYEGSVGRADPSADEQLALARRYNDALSAGAVLEANANVPTGDGTSGDDSLDYDSILTADGTGLMARLKVPAADIDLPIYHGTSDDTLLKGLGHLEGTSLPVGGQGQRTVITGHRGLAEARMFTDLDKVEPGDTFTFEVFGEVLTYSVIDKKVVEPEETEALRAEPGRDLATLVTCTPLGINTHRILITGERVYPTPQKDVDAAGAAPEIPGFPWWAVGLLGGVSLIGVYVWRSGYPSRSGNRANTE